ncbi:prospero homeobox protein 2 [Arapaima gigas]
MNLSLSDQSTHHSSKSSLEEEKPELLHPCFRRLIYDDSLAKYSNSSIISQLLCKNIQNKRILDEGVYYLPSAAMSSLDKADSGQEDPNSTSSNNGIVEPTSPSSQSSPESERPVSEHHRAKRARVENIIRGMAGSPSARVFSEERGEEDAREARDFYRENKRKQRAPQHQEHGLSDGASACRGSSGSTRDEECQRLRDQLHAMQRLLRQLQEKFVQVHSHSDSEQEDKEEFGSVCAADHKEVTGDQDELQEGSETEVHMDLDHESGRRLDGTNINRRESVKKDSGHVMVCTEGMNLQEALKYELSRAISDTVDVFFKKFSATLLNQPMPMSVAQPQVNGNMAAKKSVKNLGSPELSKTEEAMKSNPLTYYESAEGQSSEDQTEALSLVVRKPPLSHQGATSQGVKRPFALHQTPFPLGYNAPFHENQILEHLLKYGPHGTFGSFSCLPPPMDRSSPESVDLVSSVPSSHHVRQAALGPVMVDSLSIPHVKMECGDLATMAERNPYMPLNISFQIEGLTPSHLKKAKLMFFYTRYPSSSVLKTFFPDVKFNRCITSQLIKWFSNFREFYYIQMEKYARQAIVDGVNDVKEMCVTRDSELFRALNMHYNKANDFQVPDRFLEVAEITLQEFFNAISLAKDSDPSWKKAIYKVICKLDSEVPEEFKSSSYL